MGAYADAVAESKGKPATVAEPLEVVDPAGLTVAELRQLLERRGIAYPATARKAELVELAQ